MQGRAATAAAAAVLVAGMLLQPAATFGFPPAPALAASATRRACGAAGASRRRPQPGRGLAAVRASDGAEEPAMRKNPSLYAETTPGATAGPARTTGSVFKSEGRGEHSVATQMVKPEVLAPAGGWPQLRAAVQNGADACYFGLENFNARARASNFHPYDDLPQVMTYLHEHGVKVIRPLLLVRRRTRI